MARASLWTRLRTLEQRFPVPNPDGEIWVITRTVVDTNPNGGPPIEAPYDPERRAAIIAAAMERAQARGRVVELILDGDDVYDEADMAAGRLPTRPPRTEPDGHA